MIQRLLGLFRYYSLRMPLPVLLQDLRLHVREKVETSSGLQELHVVSRVSVVRGWVLTLTKD